MRVEVSFPSPSGALMPPVASALALNVTRQNADALPTMYRVESGRSIPFMCVATKSSSKTKSGPRRKRRTQRTRRAPCNANQRGGLSRKKFKLLKKEASQAAVDNKSNKVNSDADEFPALPGITVATSTSAQIWPCPPTPVASSNGRKKPARLVLLNVHSKTVCTSRIVVQSIRVPGARFASLRTTNEKLSPHVVITRVRRRPAARAEIEDSRANLRPRLNVSVPRIVSRLRRRAVIPRLQLVRQSCLKDAPIVQVQTSGKNRRALALFPTAQLADTKAKKKLGFTPEWSRLRRYRLFACKFQSVRRASANVGTTTESH